MWGFLNRLAVDRERERNSCRLKTTRTCDGHECRKKSLKFVDLVKLGLIYLAFFRD